MKKNFLLFLCWGILAWGCGPAKKPAGSASAVLLDTAGWITDTLSQGLTWYRYEGFYEPYDSHQSINVIEIDTEHYRLLMGEQRPSDSISAIASRIPGALAAVNGTYYEIVRDVEPGRELNSSFLKSDGVLRSEVGVSEGHRLSWKHEGAFYYDRDSLRLGILYGTNETYKKLPYANIISGSPMLIYDQDPVGARFAQPRDMPLDSLDYEDPDRHQGVRHPRTAIAVSGNNKVLLITVDGRAELAAGMSAKELTRFIQTYFKPERALNLDGGGSTTMWIRGSNLSENNVVNYPSDNKQFDHYGQRKIRTYIAVAPATN